MNTKRADNKAKFLIQALTIPRFTQKLKAKQVNQSRQTLRGLMGEVSPDVKAKIEEVLEFEYA